MMHEPARNGKTIHIVVSWNTSFALCGAPTSHDYRVVDKDATCKSCIRMVQAEAKRYESE